MTFRAEVLPNMTYTSSPLEYAYGFLKTPQMLAELQTPCPQRKNTPPHKWTQTAADEQWTAWERGYITETQSQESMSTCSSTLGLDRKLFITASCAGKHLGFPFEIDSWHGFAVRDTGSEKKIQSLRRMQELWSSDLYLPWCFENLLQKKPHGPGVEGWEERGSWANSHEAGTKRCSVFLS